MELQVCELDFLVKKELFKMPVKAGATHTTDDRPKG